MVISMLAIAASAEAQQQASPGVTTQPAAPTGTPSTTATTATAPASEAPAAQPTRPSSDAIKEARRAGYTMKTKSGNYFFCKEDADVGTRLATEHCVDAEALALTLERQQMDRDALKNSRTSSSSR